MESVLSSLRVVPLQRLHLHEHVDEQRAQRLQVELERSGCQRNPVLATPLGDGEWMVLDGAHRVAGLRRCGLAAALVQAVDLGDGAQLDAWAHLVEHPLPASMLWSYRYLLWRDRAAGDEGDPSYVASVRTEGQEWSLYAHQSDLSGVVTALRGLAEPYHHTRPVHRVPASLAGPLMPRSQELLIRFRRFTSEQLAEIVRRGLCLPPGITRFVVPGRILGVNQPLASLQHVDDDGGEAVLAPLLARLRAQTLRYYAEPVYLFE